MRILARYLTPDQRTALLDELRDSNVNTIFGDHVLARMKEKGITTTEVNTAVRDGYLVEYNDEVASERRVLVRNTDVAAVVDLGSHRVVTSHRAEHPNDNHWTLDRSKYTCHPVRDVELGIDRKQGRRHA